MSLTVLCFFTLTFSNLRLSIYSSLAALTRFMVNHRALAHITSGSKGTVTGHVVKA